MTPRSSKATAKSEPTLLAVLAHPLRPLILDALEVEDLSPTRFVDLGYMPSKLFKDRAEGVSKVAFHFRALEEAGCIEVIKRVPRRGGTERIFRGTGKACMSVDGFSDLPFERRQQLSAAGFQAIAARTERAIRLGSFDRADRRHMTWGNCLVDREGFDDLMRILDEASAAAEEICVAASTRLNDQDAADQEGITVTFSLLGYEPAPPMDR